MRWQEHYREALVEVDPARLLSLIRDTESAMTVRSESLPTVTTYDIQEMNDANITLRALKSYTQGRWSY